ncbi:hypothetical protein [Salinivibrio costicola]|jgi:hypothetical protein|uniref:hypothetical protein n=1 Tax=Salinivibrio costicola TaxID=51367 RepID=UPI003F6EB0F0
MNNQESKTVSLKMDFDVEGVQFAESMIETLKANVEHAIARCVSEGVLTDNNQDNVSVSLKNVSHFSPCVTVLFDTVCIEKIVTNMEGITVNVFSDADVPEEEEIFELNGYEHHLSDTSMVTCNKNGSDQCEQAAKAVRIMQQGTFVDIDKADLIQSDALMMVRPAFYTESKGWHYEHQGESNELIERGFEVYLDDGEDAPAIYRFTSEDQANIAVKVWTEMRTRL